MIFSSIAFIFAFLPVFLLVYYLTPIAYRNVTLFLGSLVFYAYGEPKFVLLLLASVAMNYLLGRGMADSEKLPGDGGRQAATKYGNSPRRMVCLLLGIAIDVAILIYFKLASDSVGLPLGISFYSFQSISYLCDVYRRDIRPEKNFLRLGCYICMFPQLVAGPIVLYEEVERDMKKPVFSWENIDQGLKDFTIGLCMKLLLADRLAVFWRDISTAGYESLSTSLAWLGAISYSLQIYFDFFGYSMMAIGLGKMLGFSLPRNFSMPYRAGSIREFYRRWHMTLGRWFTKYVYIPLGGSRRGLAVTLRNLLIVWILTSMWHGIGLHFLLWGMLLCLMIMLEKIVPFGRLTEKLLPQKEQVDTRTAYSSKRMKKYVKSKGGRRSDRAGSGKISYSAGNEKTSVKEMTGKLLKTMLRSIATGLVKVLPHVYVILVIVLSWVCFAIEDISILMTYLGRMFGLVPGEHISAAFASAQYQKYGWTILIGILLALLPVDRWYAKGKNHPLGMLLMTGLFWLAIYYVVVMGNNPFMYFRF